MSEFVCINQIPLVHSGTVNFSDTGIFTLWFKALHLLRTIYFRWSKNSVQMKNGFMTQHELPYVFRSVLNVFVRKSVDICHIFIVFWPTSIPLGNDIMFHGVTFIEILFSKKNH